MISMVETGGECRRESSNALAHVESWGDLQWKVKMRGEGERSQGLQTSCL